MAFVLPVWIDNRKIISLDLENRSSQYYQEKDQHVDEDIYIIDKPNQIPEKKTIRLLPNHSLISRHATENDIEISRLGYDISYDYNGQQLTIELKSSSPLEINNLPDWLSVDNIDGLSISLQGTDNRIDIPLEFFVKFIYTVSDREFGALIKIILADQEDIQLVGLDFGSEASQMVEGFFDSVDVNQINSSHVSLFNLVKNSNSVFDERGNIFLNESYVQYDKDSAEFYKSIFFIQKNIHTNQTKEQALRGFNQGSFLFNKNDFNFLTSIDREESSDFAQESHQIPNLKLVHTNNPQALSDNIEVNCDGDQRFQRSITSAKSSIYKRLLQELITAYLNQNLVQNSFLRFTILVPNIYSVSQIIDTRRTIRAIISEYLTQNKIIIRGLEISSLSESDASFMGYITSIQPDINKYYLTIDCGKGTTDFSINMIDPNDPNIIKPIYRDGFAGAGNLISFALMETVFYRILTGFYESYIYKVRNQDENNRTLIGKTTKQELLKFFEQLLSEKPNYKHWFYNLIEEFKINYDPSLSQRTIDRQWSNVRDGSLTFETFIDKLSTSPDPFLDFNILMKKIKNIYDWNGYIAEACREISELLELNLKTVIKHLNKTSKCGGVILTGRSFKFKPLVDQIQKKIKEFEGMSNVRFFQIQDHELKSICLKGIFERNLVHFSDLTSTPIEVQRGSLIRIRNKSSNGFLNKIKRIISRYSQDYEIDFLPNDKALSIPLINTNLAQVQFLIGGTIYNPGSTQNFNSANLIQYRKGLIIRGRISGNSNNQFVLLNTVGAPQGAAIRVSEALKKSLVPGILDNKLIRPLQNTL